MFKFFICILLTSINAVAADKNYSIEFRTSFQSCRQLNESEDTVDIIHFGKHDDDDNCLDDSNLKCLEKITFFTITAPTKIKNSINESVLCQYNPGSSLCFEVPFIINPDDNENFLEITDLKYEFGQPTRNDVFRMKKEHVLGRWKKFIQIFDGGCDFKEIKFKVINR